MESLSSVPPLIVVLGPTASGKSALGLKLAEILGGEIIAADSRTIYRGMNIGTAKPSSYEMAHVPHHIVDIATIDEEFSVADFQIYAKRAITDITDRNKIPIMVGGTGLYIDSILYDFSFRPKASDKVRNQLSGHTVQDLQALIAQRGLALPKNTKNPRHLIRVLETEGKVGVRSPLRQNTLILSLAISRDEITNRIVARTKRMFENGLEAEVRALVQQYGWDKRPLQTIGYQEFQPYFEGQVTLAEVEAAIIKNTRAYAKRQVTWFKRNTSVNYIDDWEKAVALTTTFLGTNNNNINSCLIQ